MPSRYSVGIQRRAERERHLNNYSSETFDARGRDRRRFVSPLVYRAGFFVAE
jgi:hypothetical protein